LYKYSRESRATAIINSAILDYALYVCNYIIIIIQIRGKSYFATTFKNYSHRLHHNGVTGTRRTRNLARGAIHCIPKRKPPNFWQLLSQILTDFQNPFPVEKRMKFPTKTT